MMVIIECPKDIKSLVYSLLTQIKDGRSFTYEDFLIIIGKELNIVIVTIVVVVCIAIRCASKCVDIEGYERENRLQIINSNVLLFRTHTRNLGRGCRLCSS